MNIRAVVAFAAIALASASSAEPSKSPGMWCSVATNEIAKWNAAHGAKDGVVVDRAARTATFLAEASGVLKADPVEFLLIGPESDNAYETFAVSAASPSAIAAALDAIGVPRGRPVDPPGSRFWPQGERISISFRKVADGTGLRIDDILSDAHSADETAILELPIVSTGGARDSSGIPVAAATSPCAIFALYSHSPSLLQFDGTFDQSSVYGRFKVKNPCKAGELFEVTLSYDGTKLVEEKIVSIGKGTDLAAVLGSLRERAKSVSLYASLSFSPDVTLAEAARTAKAFSLVDGAGVRMNGIAPGQFFYRAYLPETEWRRREGRIFQPFEVHVAADGVRKFVFIEEDYSGEGLDPVLKPHETRFSKWSELPALIKNTKADKVNVLFIYAPQSTPVGELTPISAALSGRITTFYLFDEEAK